MGRLESPYHLRRGGDGDGGGVLRVLVRPFHGQRRRKIASEIGSSAQIWHQAGGDLGLPAAAAAALGYYTAVHKNLTVSVPGHLGGAMPPDA